jgi:hypothetical protein
MDAVIAWCAFTGSWLLFAGPVYQASLELREEGLERERIEELTAGVAKPAPISAWWWLLPPVRFELGRRRSAEYRRRTMAAIGPDDLAALVRFLNKAFGGLLLAVNETWLLRERYDWPIGVFVVICVFAAAVGAAYPAIGAARARRLLDHPS